MHITLLHNHLKKSLPLFNKATLHRLVMISEPLLTGSSNLSLTDLGRSLKGKAQPKNKIKAIDRLLGHKKLYEERENIYKALSELGIGSGKKVEILIDWSPCGNREQQMLRASYYHKSRSSVLYEEVHPEKTKGTRRSIHKQFLCKLKSILPNDIEVTVISDAGFKTDFFMQVQEMGWDFTGRIRGNMQYLENDFFKKAVDLYEKATDTPVFVGSVLLSKENKVPCQMYLYKGKNIIKKKTKKRKKLSSRSSKKHHKGEDDHARKKAADPWLIVTSKPNKYSSAKKIIDSYTKRMKIELEFRSTKNMQVGVGLDKARSRDEKRLEILLLIGALAMFMLWIVGLAGEYKSLQYNYQANTIKTHRVLSVIYLGMQIINQAKYEITKDDLLITIKQIQGSFEHD
jgi:hypothetical protein